MRTCTETNVNYASTGRTPISGLTRRGIALLIAAFLMTTLPSIKWKQDAPIFADTSDEPTTIDSTEYFKEQAKLNVDILEYQIKKRHGLID